MRKDAERMERELRGKRLADARRRAGFAGPKGVSEATGVPVDRYKGHESGRNGFGIADARVYAKVFKVSLQWLNFGIGSISDPYVDTTAEQAEYLDLLDHLPASLQRQQIESLRALVEALEKPTPAE